LTEKRGEIYFCVIAFTQFTSRRNLTLGALKDIMSFRSIPSLLGSSGRQPVAVALIAGRA
jgi:hypothetical protein